MLEAQGIGDSCPVGRIDFGEQGHLPLYGCGGYSLHVGGNAFEQTLFAKRLCHMGQPALAQAASNCEKRAIGTNGGFGYRSLVEGVKVELLESAALAVWKCAEEKEKHTQRIRY